MTTDDFDNAAANRHYSTACLDRVRELLEKTDRSPDEDRWMVSMCHACLFHRQQRPDFTARDLSIGYWQLSRVYAVLGQADNARESARHCARFSQGEGPFFIGFACEALARAEFLDGNFHAGEHFLAEAYIYAAQITDSSERELLECDLGAMKLTMKSDRRRLTFHELDVIREALVAEIYDVFRDVSRAGGVSWGDSVLIDNYGWRGGKPPRPDSEAHWTQLVDDETWNPDPGTGGFSFLDPIGFRYYLPPAMVRCLRTGFDEGIRFHLGEPSLELREYRREQLSLLDHRHRRCIARFLLYMVRKSDEPYLTGNPKDEWLETLNTGWWKDLEPDFPTGN